ncbi:response regulator transcription factor [Streptomyces corynorhini]|uniref:DNA-binding response regulator n=1 Tax=Streptomyces corynorhini TaxID=2282652 RepID=A0A370BGR5_9ACTN|nr:response regulator transcription factor [Streptomyces corynorhini]RDG38993.1 DNA-binding response regulator [Streptomyces corynorhini]
MYGKISEKPRYANADGATPGYGGAWTPAPPRGEGRRVLIVGDDPPTVELLSTTMELAGYRIATAGSGPEALTRLVEHPADLVVLDMGLEDLKHFSGYPRLPVADRPPLLFLTACESLDSLAPGLGPGVSDYVVKPFRVAEVLARAQTLLRTRHHESRHGAAPHFGDLTLDDNTCRAHRGRRTLDLTPAEYRLLRHLLLHAEQVLSKEQICRHVWGEDRADNAIEKLVSRLRRKVNQEDPPLIHTRKGFGYWLGI